MSTKRIPQFNAKRVARRAKEYRRVIASDFHKRLRYDAFLRSGGLCECKECVTLRREWPASPELPRAITQIPVWFTKGGGAPHRRFRSTAGEIHHTSYRLYGQENPDELAFVRWIWKECHQRIEAQLGTRRRYLKGTQ